jgi:sugar lactone lactonase YvrE
MSAPFELVQKARCRCRLGESPVWLSASGVLVFVDITGRALHRFNPLTGILYTAAIGEDIGCVAPSKGGGYVAGLRSGVWLLHESGAKWRRLAENPENPVTNRFNDGRVDPRGRFLVGTIDEPKAGGTAGLYRCDRTGITRLADGLLSSNGLAFSPDGRTLYHADTPRFVVYRYDYDLDTGSAVNRRVFIQLDPSASDRGRPDGAAVDEEGCYWTALYEGGRIQRYDPDGRLISEHAVPARIPTMPAFGGTDRKTLFVTTAHDKRGGPGGGLYALAVDVAGIPAVLFDSEA